MIRWRVANVEALSGPRQRLPALLNPELKEEIFHVLVPDVTVGVEANYAVDVATSSRLRIDSLCGTAADALVCV